MPDPITIAILAPGDMGSGVGQAMLAEGHRVVSALYGRSAHTKSLAEAAGIEDLGTVTDAVAAA
ncbi:MAG: NAD(P)-dependent oxidoreductase, partial [Pseudomonadota bacterium]